MGLVIKVELQGDGVYLAGERVTCAITLTNSGAGPRMIAWMGAQVHCQCSYRRDLKLVGPSSSSITTTTTALPSPVTDTTFVPNRDEPGLTLASTPTVVLLCNLILQPQEGRTVVYDDAIPAGCPPSFSGRLVQYKYKVTVGAQELGCPTHSIRIPFRVLTAPASLTCHPPVLPMPTSNPFLSPQEQHQSLEERLHTLTTEASRRATMSYTLKSSHGVVGRLTLFKSSYKLGEDIVGTFDFSCDTVTCLQLYVVLQSLEEISEDFAPPPPTRIKPSCTTHAHHIECCHNAKQTHFALPVPQNVTQSFQIHAVKLLWQLHFEFVITKESPSELVKASVTPCLAGSKATLWEGLQPVAMESMTWNLPVTILPTLPLQQTHKPHTLVL